LERNLWLPCIKGADFPARQVLTFPSSDAYMMPEFGTPPPRRDGASSKLLIDIRWPGSDSDRKPQASTAMRLSTLRPRRVGPPWSRAVWQVN